jgi:hypothetical protein
METAAPNPTIDRVFSQAKSQKLLPRNHAMLPPRELRNRVIPTASLR